MPKRKLTDEQVHEICKLIEEGFTLTEISEKYGVALATVSDIRCGKGKRNAMISKQYNINEPQITEEEVHEICKLMEKGYTNIKLASMYGRSRNTISKIRNGVIYHNITKKYDLINSYYKCYKRLTEQQVHEICKLLEEGHSNKEIAKKFNIDHSTVSDIRCGASHKDISSRYNIRRKTLTVEQIHEICKLLEEGYDNNQIGDKYNISPNTVSNIRNGNVHEDISEKYSLPITKIEDQVVHEICKLLEEGESNAEIAKMYNLDPAVLSSIRCGKYYVEISKNYNIERYDAHEHIDEECAHEICRLLEAGYRNFEVADICNVSRQIVGAIRCGLNHKDISKLYNIERIRRKRLISDKAIHEVCRLIDAGYKRKDISSLTNVTIGTIDLIKNSRRYEDIACHYNFYKNKKNTQYGYSFFIFFCMFP